MDYKINVNAAIGGKNHVANVGGVFGVGVLVCYIVVFAESTIRAARFASLVEIVSDIVGVGI